MSILTEEKEPLKEAWMVAGRKLDAVLIKAEAEVSAARDAEREAWADWVEAINGLRRFRQHRTEKGDKE